uniref:Uncharacterized protein n=1 Tax=Panagrolaimus sp. ES5 TaxID=591445 RepID=A0AC34GHZ3_9BILA
MMQELNLFINPGTGEFLHPNDSAATSEVDKHVEPSLVHSYHQYASDPSAAAAALPYPNPFGRGAPQPYQQQPPQEQQPNPFLQPMNPKVDDILENLFAGDDLPDSIRKYMNLGSYEKDENVVSSAAAAPSDSSLLGLPPTLNGYIQKFEAAINEPSGVGADKKINDHDASKVVPDIPPRVAVADNKINDDSAMFETVQGPSKVVSDKNDSVALKTVQNTVTAAGADKKINDIDPVKV